MVRNDSFSIIKTLSAIFLDNICIFIWKFLFHFDVAHRLAKNVINRGANDTERKIPWREELWGEKSEYG